MEINYLILVHKNPFQVKRLVQKLQGPGINFFIHIDASAEGRTFKSLLQNFENVFFICKTDRKKIIWGDISMVEASLNLMHKVVLEKKTGYCILLSGQDYPLKSKDYIKDFFQKKTGMHFISFFEMPHPNWDQGGIPRIKKYKINKSSQREHFLMLPSIFDKDFYSEETLGKLNFLRKTGRWKDMVQALKRREFPTCLEPYGGGQWWAFPIETIHKILEFNENHPNYINYHKYTLIPDEIFFQSILMYLEDYKTKNIAKSITYVNWNRGTGPLPVTFTCEDIEELEIASKNHLFARKFDIEKDEDILDQIDKQLLI
ncbi:beta-1,6-N-acetylglucosaminyltransferase [Christiangramia aquimixticola]|uniref:beta-1,6-N-acetylglucosaminyltransferase n=1 Tax=Christiangramia aquimixticola TaxID=1697558 RepID=UPI003AA891FB